MYVCMYVCTHMSVHIYIYMTSRGIMPRFCGRVQDGLGLTLTRSCWERIRGPMPWEPANLLGSAIPYG